MQTPTGRMPCEDEGDTAEAEEGWIASKSPAAQRDVEHHHSQKVPALLIP